MSCCMQKTDNGPNPYVANIEKMTLQNQNFRTAIWTGNHLQMTLMSIPPCNDIGLEIHEDTDQLLMIEQGNGVVQMGECKDNLNFCANISKGDSIFVPAGTWHNVINTGRTCLKLSSVYAPPNHPRGTIHRTKKDAQKEEE